VVQRAEVPNGPVAIKVISKKKVKGHEPMVYEEISLLTRVNHPRIVRFFEWFESSKNFYIVTEFATGGELFETICDCGKISERDAVSVVKETLEVVEYLHSMEIVHRGKPCKKPRRF
jgi:calcium/calmodulin-dependent protein kinase I